MKKKVMIQLLVIGLLVTACAGKAGVGENVQQPQAEQQTDEKQDAPADAADETTDTEQEPSETDTTEQEPSETDAAQAEQTEPDGEEAPEDAAEPVELPLGSTLVEVPEAAPLELPDSEAVAFVQDMKLGWNLGNTFDASNATWLTDEMAYESAWCGEKTREEHIETLQAAGFGTIRIPVSWHNHVDENYRISDAWLDRVQEVVDWAYQRGMYVILNIHHDNEEAFEYPSYEKLDQSKAYVSAIWEQLAARFAEYDEHLIFETMNEPRQVGTDHEWWLASTTTGDGKECVECVNELNQTIVDTIRSNTDGYNPTRYIMVQGYCASPDYALASNFVLPDDSRAAADNRILISVHAYTPYDFALNMQGTDVFSIAEQKGTRDIDNFMEKLYNKYVSQGIGVVIGEFGALDKQDNIEARTEFAAYYVSRASHYGMTAVWWDNNAFSGDGEKFGLLSRSSNTFLYPQIVDQMVYYSSRS